MFVKFFEKFFFANLKSSVFRVINFPMISMMLHKKIFQFYPRHLTIYWFQGVNKDSYLILEKLPTEYDSRVKAMEVDERPTEQYSDIGGLDKQIEEVGSTFEVFSVLI